MLQVQDAVPCSAIIPSPLPTPPPHTPSPRHLPTNSPGHDMFKQDVILSGNPPSGGTNDRTRRDDSLSPLDCSFLDKRHTRLPHNCTQVDPGKKEENVPHDASVVRALFEREGWSLKPILCQQPTTSVPHTQVDKRKYIEQLPAQVDSEDQGFSRRSNPAPIGAGRCERVKVSMVESKQQLLRSPIKVWNSTRESIVLFFNCS